MVALIQNINLEKFLKYETIFDELQVHVIIDNKINFRQKFIFWSSWVKSCCVVRQLEWDELRMGSLRVVQLKEFLISDQSIGVFN